MEVKGIILAGGTGSRLWPATQATNKQLLPIYDKPMIYYPLATLMASGVREFLIITQNSNIRLYEQLLGSGDLLGISISYASQNIASGIAEALLIAESAGFLGDSKVIALILGDNLFAGEGITRQIAEVLLARRTSSKTAATVFLTEVTDPERYGVAIFEDGQIQLADIIEKPQPPSPSNWAVTGLYIYSDESVAAKVRKQRPSARGELEITDLNRTYLQEGQLGYRKLGRGSAWLDTGTPAALLQAAQYVQTIQARHDIMLGCPEEAAFDNGWLSAGDLCSQAEYHSNDYGRYLKRLLTRGAAGPCIWKKRSW